MRASDWPRRSPRWWLLGGTRVQDGPDSSEPLTEATAETWTGSDESLGQGAWVRKEKWQKTEEKAVQKVTSNVK